MQALMIHLGKPERDNGNGVGHGTASCRSFTRGTRSLGLKTVTADPAQVTCRSCLRMLNARNGLVVGFGNK